MATVLLIITIPTEIEELRQRKRSIGRSEGNDTEGYERPQLNESVRKALYSFNSCQQRQHSNMYPRASEIFSLGPPIKIVNLDVNDELEIGETSTDPVIETYAKVNISKKSFAVLQEPTNNYGNNEEVYTSSSSARSKDKKAARKVYIGIEESINQSTLETVMRQVLEELGIANALWTLTSDGRMYQILFTISFDEAYEELIYALHERGIGERAGSTIAVLSCITSKKPAFSKNAESFHEEGILADNVGDRSKEARNDTSVTPKSRNRNQTRYRKSVWERFMNSVRSRLNIAQIIRCVRQDATIDFDFTILLVSAALLSAFGLIEDSIVFLASSMLISPLMGPIIAAIFGTAIKDPLLRNMGIRNEFYGIMVSLIVGFFFGIAVCACCSQFESMDDITSEMLYRGSFHTLVMCSIAAIPSGAAVAIGILNGNMGSLIGVAISASLLPPAVNSGMLWSMTCCCLIGRIRRNGLIVRERFYFDDNVWDYLTMSVNSIGITFLNILLVFVTGVLVLKVKEVVPGIGGHNQEFWKRDIKIARNISQQELTADDAILEELNNLPSEERNVIGMNSEMLRRIQIPEGNYQNTWSPGYHNFETRNQMQSAYATVHRLDYLYSNINRGDGLSDDFFSNESAGPSNRREEQRSTNDMKYQYFVCNEQETTRNRTPSPTHKKDIPKKKVTDIDTPISIKRPPHSQARKVNRFFITPVKKDSDLDEYDA